MTELPKDLFCAEDQLLESLISCLNNSRESRLLANVKFEGLRIMPIILRIAKRLQDQEIKIAITWPDAGATALAKRDSPELLECIYSFSDLLNINSTEISNTLIIAVAPNAFDYDDFFKLCETYRDNRILMFNGRLEDLAVGIGSVARQRRKDFLSKWQYVYWLEPLDKAALMFIYQNQWNLFKLQDNGYIYLERFDIKPDQEKIFEALL